MDGMSVISPGQDLGPPTDIRHAPMARSDPATPTLTATNTSFDQNGDDASNVSSHEVLEAAPARIGQSKFNPEEKRSAHTTYLTYSHLYRGVHPFYFLEEKTDFNTVPWQEDVDRRVYQFLQSS
ncbi:hypothetical protein BU16DRAFT_554092 [Lophium mytilinum]|uniref:Uncharacterized protein n=1 Tax=Lophium mytilinum TaxID=390894 RepID=A0A6A6RBD6_9PEZI|nr:hypothetical protein BU16DRAFT_554092 [Lophium mytilinum]